MDRGDVARVADRRAPEAWRLIEVDEIDKSWRITWQTYRGGDEEYLCTCVEKALVKKLGARAVEDAVADAVEHLDRGARRKRYERAVATARQTSN